ncbi:MAG TPA: hypothetical protein VKU00_15775 [Chthonomonadaceae bacterium]|nr:hypothetical protein [Chthonomonadaceae bacterium]
MDTVDVEQIAEAVLYEGYLLFPYRRSALKNRQRWTFGGVYPRAYSEATGGSDPWRMQTQCLVVGNAETQLDIKVRFLQVIDRRVLTDVAGTLRPVEELRIDGQTYRPWEEAREREIRLRDTSGDRPLRLGDLLTTGRLFPITIPAGSEEEPLRSSDGRDQGILVHAWRALWGDIEVAAEALELPAEEREALAPGEALYRVTVQIVNCTPWSEEGEEMPSRQEAVQQAFISTHTILRVEDGAFVSLLEPPDAYQRAAGECENIKTWPVLVGEPGERHTLLSSPIILYDYPQISSESQGNFFDATEIDELLTLSVMTLTDDEKQEMRESDAHGRAILERTELLSEEQIMKLHGVVRYLQPTRREGA